MNGIASDLSYAVGSRSVAVREPTRTARRASRRSSTWRVRLHLNPGQKGTKQLLEQYGDRLVCVRYRYDAQRRKRVKTVEVIVAERDWNPPLPRIGPDQIVGLRVDFDEASLRACVKQAGGKWDPEHRLWRLRFDRALTLGLRDRIVDASAGRHS